MGSKGKTDKVAEQTDGRRDGKRDQTKNIMADRWTPKIRKMQTDRLRKKIGARRRSCVDFRRIKGRYSCRIFEADRTT